MWQRKKWLNVLTTDNSFYDDKIRQNVRQLTVKSYGINQTGQNILCVNRFVH